MLMFLFCLFSIELMSKKIKLFYELQFLRFPSVYCQKNLKFEKDVVCNFL